MIWHAHAHCSFNFSCLNTLEDLLHSFSPTPLGFFTCVRVPRYVLYYHLIKTRVPTRINLGCYHFVARDEVRGSFLGSERY